MGWGKLRFLVVLVAGVILSSLCATAQHSAIDLKGQTVDPFTASHDKIVVLVFLRRDCPVSGRYAPTVQQISKKYSTNVRFWLVYPDKSETPEAIRKSVAEYGYTIPVLRDPEHALANFAHVQITPEVAVFDRDGKLAYDGRIDDTYIDLSRARPSPTTHELDDAIRATLAGQAVARNEIRGVGCYIADLQ